MAIVFSKLSGKNDPLYGKFEHPIKAIIQNESNALEKKKTLLNTVIKTKSFKNSSAKVKVRTNKKPYNQIARINNAIFSFEDLDFSDLTFNTTEQSLFAIKEKEKQWVEKQYYLFSDEYLKPFALFSISYRYRVAGRYKG